jgi:hypothetical protein
VTEPRPARVLVVPTTPGPLVHPRPERAPDELDELFGPEPDAAVGWLDGVLLVGGLALLLLALTVWDSTGLAVIAGILLFLGAILPVRAAARRLGARGEGSRRAKGLVLDVGHPLTARLAEAYAALLAEPELPFRTEALSAAHMALIESATMLDGAPPATDVQAAYVEKRVAAIEALTQAATEARQAERAEEHAVRSAAADELDGSGLSSLSDLGALTQLLRESRRDAGT